MTTDSSSPCRAEIAATKLLLEQRLYSTKIDVMSFRYDKNIKFNTFEFFCRNSCAELASFDRQDGCVIKRGNGANAIYIVLYNDNVRSRGRRSFTLAHEIGHIYLNHTLGKSSEETEADRFAAALLMPNILVYELLRRFGPKLTGGELARIFGVSVAAASNRLNDVKGLSRMSFTENERSLLKKLSGLLPDLDGAVIDF